MMVMVDETTGNKYMRAVPHKVLEEEMSAAEKKLPQTNCLPWSCFSSSPKRCRCSNVARDGDEAIRERTGPPGSEAGLLGV